MKKETKCVHTGSYRDVVVNKLAALEETEDGVLFSSGMAAMSTSVMSFARSGDHVVMRNALYGGTHAFATYLLDRLGIHYNFTTTGSDAVCSIVNDRTKVIVKESPTNNPLMDIIDIRKVARFAKTRGITTIIDNTFATPVNQNPIKLGIDIVVHSGTKYLGGHSDICCGIAVTSSKNTRHIRTTARHLGGSLGGVETTICSPATTSHAKISAEERKRVGITDSLLRLSAGIEHVEDLVADLDQALNS